MPTGGSYTGVWFSPQYGQMDMEQTGNAVVGRYEKDERSGSIQGTVEGDLLRFEWQEEREMVAGRPSTTRGRGYFRYEIGQDGKHYIRGEWGLDDAETGGGEWNAYRMRGRQPNLSTDTSGDDEDTGDSFDSAEGGDSYDSGGGDEPSDEDDGLGDLDL
jgi:hypothetical protein